MAGAGEGAVGEEEDGRLHPLPAGGAQQRHERAQQAQGTRQRRRRRRRRGGRQGDRPAGGGCQVRRDRRRQATAAPTVAVDDGDGGGGGGGERVPRRIPEEEVRDVRRPAAPDGISVRPRATAGAIAGRGDRAASSSQPQQHTLAAAAPRGAVHEADVGRPWHDEGGGGGGGRSGGEKEEEIADSSGGSTLHEEEEEQQQQQLQLQQRRHGDQPAHLLLILPVRCSHRTLLHRRIY